MASKINKVKIDVTANTKKAEKNLENLSKAETRLGQTTASAGRQFSSQAQGLGGLVAAYAGAAANVFALQQAFDALRRAAQAETIVKGTKSLALAVAQDGDRIISSITKITQGQLTLAEVAQQANISLSAGFSTDQIERLSDVSVRASRALGRTLSDAFTRVTRGAAKLEPELLDELGIFVRIDPAVEKYAAKLGVAASSLTNFERRQAFVNAVIEEGEAKFSSIDIASESSQKSIERFTVTIVNLATKFGQVIAGPVSSVLDFFEDDIGNALVVFGGILALVFGKATQVIGGFAATAIKDLTAFADVLATTANKSNSNLRTISNGVIDLDNAISERGGLAKKGGAFAQKGVARADAQAGAQIRQRFRAGGVSPRQMQDDLAQLKRIKPALDKNSAAFKDSAIIIDTYDKSLKGTTVTSKLLTKTSIGLTRALRGVGVAARFAFKFLNIFIAILAGAQFLASFFGLKDIVGDIADAFQDMSTRADDIADGVKGAVMKATPAVKELNKTLEAAGVKEEDIKSFGEDSLKVLEEVNEKANKLIQRNLSKQQQQLKSDLLRPPPGQSKEEVLDKFMEDKLATKEAARKKIIDLEILQINKALTATQSRRNKLTQDQRAALTLRLEQLKSIQDVSEGDFARAELVGRIARTLNIPLKDAAVALDKLNQSGKKGVFSFLGIEIKSTGIAAETTSASLANLSTKEQEAIKNAVIFNTALDDADERFQRGAISTDQYQQALKGLRDRFKELEEVGGKFSTTLDEFSLKLALAEERVKDLKLLDSLTKALKDNFKGVSETVDKAFGKGLANSLGEVATTQEEVTQNQRDFITNLRVSAGELLLLNDLAKDGIELDEETQLLATLTRDQLKAQEGEIIKIINASGKLLRTFQKQELSLRAQLSILKAQAALTEAQQDAASISLEAKILNREVGEEVKLQQANLNLLKAQNDASKIAVNLQKERFKVLQDTKRTQENIDESKRKQAASGVIAGLGRDVTQAQAELADLQRFDNLSTQDSRVEKQKEIIKLEFKLQMAVIEEKERAARQEAENALRENADKLKLLNLERDQNAEDMRKINQVAEKQAQLRAATNAQELAKINQEKDRLVAEKDIIGKQEKVALLQLDAEQKKRDFDQALLDLRIKADQNFTTTVNALIAVLNSEDSAFFKAAQAVGIKPIKGVAKQGEAVTTDLTAAQARVRQAQGEVDTARRDAITGKSANRLELVNREIESIKEILELTKTRQNLENEVAEQQVANKLDEKIGREQILEFQRQGLNKESESIRQILEERLSALEDERKGVIQNSKIATDRVNDENNALSQLGQTVGGNLKNSFREFYSSIAEGNSVLDSAKGAFQSFMLSLIDSIQEKLTQKFIDPVIDSVMGAIFRAGGGPVYLASGGTMKRDRVPAMLEPGEFVIRKPMAKAIGGPGLSAMNGHGKGLGMPTIDVQINNSGQPKDAEAQVKPNMDVNKMVVEIVTRDLRNNGPIRKTLRGDS